MTIEKLKKMEYARAMRLAERSFLALDAADYSDYGKKSFLSYASSLNFALRQASNHVSFAAKQDGYLVGIIELRSASHISMLFVEPTFVRHGVASALVKHVIDYARKLRPDIDVMTVNSSPYALPFYRQMGFCAVSRLVDEDGFVYVPMELRFNA